MSLKAITLSVETDTQGWQAHIEQAGATRQLRFGVANGRISAPKVADGLAFAVLPLALRAKCDLYVNAPLSRTALRNLRELAEGWHSWNATSFHPSKVICESVVDAPRQVNAKVAMAWSGDLRSTFALAGGEPSLQYAGYAVDAGVYVKGLGPKTAVLDQRIHEVAAQFAEAGKTLTVIESNADQIGLIDPAIGVLPLVSAALHLACAGQFGMAVHAVSEPVRAQSIRPRRIPSHADFYSGDYLRVASVGGACSAPAMVRYLAQQPGFARYLDSCRSNGFNGPRCRACYECELLELGFSGAALAGRAGRGKCFWLVSPNHAADAALALADWQGSWLTRTGLATRLTAQEVSRALRERDTWRKALRNEVTPWPR